MYSLLTKGLIVLSGLLLGIGVLKTQFGQDKKEQIISPIRQKAEEKATEILGEVAEVLPGVSFQKPEKTGEENQVKGISREGEDSGVEETQESEPIKEPVENIQNQTQRLIESIKNLPEDQILAIKKQLYSQFCEDLLREIE